MQVVFVLWLLMGFKHYNILSLNVQDWRCEFRFFILHWFISANLCAQLCPTYFFRLVHWTLFVFSNAPLGLVKSSSLNTLFFTSCLPANKKKLFRQIARAEFTLPSMHSNKRWEGDVEWESGFSSLFFLNLFFFFLPISCFTWGQESRWQWNGLLWSVLPCCAATSLPGCHYKATARMLMGKLHLLFVENSSSTSNVCSV